MVTEVKPSHVFTVLSRYVVYKLSSRYTVRDIKSSDVSLFFGSFVYTV